jgi:phosphoribosylaminoimidazole-succinocarboxamide synthase
MLKLLHRGKVKDVYAVDNHTLLFHFSDRISAFDIKMNQSIPKKGAILCKFSEFWFNTLPIENHMIRVTGKDKMLVKRLKIYPIECVVRGFLYGSLIERYKEGSLVIKFPSSFQPIIAAKLPQPIFDPTTKSEEHDIPIEEDNIINNSFMTRKEFDYVKKTSISLYNRMNQIADKFGFIIGDVKFEFGKDPESEKILLADSLGPDEYRLWLKSEYRPGMLQESYDKQLLRDWLTQIGFKDIVNRWAKQGKKPPSPQIPREIIDKISDRYTLAYQTFSGHTIDS